MLSCSYENQKNYQKVVYHYFGGMVLFYPSRGVVCMNTYIYIYYVNIMYILCIYYVYIMYILCIYYVYIMYILCIYYVYIMYILCIYYVYIMYILCIYKYTQYNTCTSFLCWSQDHHSSLDPHRGFKPDRCQVILGMGQS